MEGIRDLAAAIIHRAIEDANGNGAVYVYNNAKGLTKEKQKEYRERYKRLLQQQAVNFLRGGGNFEMFAQVLGREPDSLSNDLRGFYGTGADSGRDAKGGAERRHKRVITCVKPGVSA